MLHVEQVRTGRITFPAFPGDDVEYDISETVISTILRTITTQDPVVLGAEAEFFIDPFSVVFLTIQDGRTWRRELLDSGTFDILEMIYGGDAFPSFESAFADWRQRVTPQLEAQTREEDLWPSMDHWMHFADQEQLCDLWVEQRRQGATEEEAETAVRKLYTSWDDDVKIHPTPWAIPLSELNACLARWCAENDGEMYVPRPLSSLEEKRRNRAL